MTLLQGLRVLNTRPLEQGERLSASLREMGAVSVALPALIIEATPCDWLNHLPPLATIHQAIFVSANAVKPFFSGLNDACMRWSDTIQVLAVGTFTAKALEKQGVLVHYVPDCFDSEHLLDLDALNDISGQRIVLIKGVDGRPFIANTLINRGADLVTLDVYSRQTPVFDSDVVCSIWQDDAVDIILFTSIHAMRNIFSMFSDSEARRWLCHKPCVVFSQRIAMEASVLGMQTILISPPDDLFNVLKGFK